MTKLTRRSAIAATTASLAFVDRGARAEERDGMTWYVASPGKRTELQMFLVQPNNVHVVPNFVSSS